MGMENNPLEQTNNVYDFEAAKNRARRNKPAKPPYSGPTEFRLLEKAAEAKQINEQAESLGEQIAKLEKIAAELEQDYLIALAKKDRKERVEDSKSIFESLTRVNSEIIKLKGLIIDARTHVRSLDEEGQK